MLFWIALFGRALEQLRSREKAEQANAPNIIPVKLIQQESKGTDNQDIELIWCNTP